MRICSSCTSFNATRPLLLSYSLRFILHSLVHWREALSDLESSSGDEPAWQPHLKSREYGKIVTMFPITMTMDFIDTRLNTQECITSEQNIKSGGKQVSSSHEWG